VLIVDDDLTTIRSLDGLLRRAGIETVCAHDLAGATALIHSRPVSLVLLDVHLPDGNGLDLCRRVAADPSNATVPILFISANDDIETKIEGFAAGGVDYITKPLSGAEVLARVRTHLRLRAAYESLSELQTERIQRLAASQQSLMPLPESLPETGFQVCMRQVLQAGGDFYDVFPSGNQVADYVVADASGHDLGASLWTASFKTLLAEYASILHEPAVICRMINTSLKRVLPESAYFTAIYARLNRAANKLALVNAGHPSAILVSARTHTASLLTQEGDLIGMFPDASFGLLEVSVKPGDRLFLYSDGLVEMGLSRDAGTHRLIDTCRIAGPLPLKEAVVFIVDKLCSGGKPEDDIVLMGVEV
jgi:sigma-B regulation protein RsbU (phosphoserine phosphatase)